jgi:serine/threonine-protein kinase
MTGIPSSIGRYQVRRSLGQGAMGTVYLAEDPMLKRRLAVKVVRAVGEERDQALERFKHEAEISAQLNHPNIVTIYDVGEEPSLGPFLAMEYVEGSSLGKIIREGSLEVESALGILIQAMRALRAAHRHAIVHRDVKPDNILVSEDGRVKLMDFGIAKTMAPRITHQGEFLGSPAYSAPELLKGHEPTPSSDRYAFAVTAFELLTGKLPHPGNSIASVITHILNQPPELPSGLPARVGYTFNKAMSQDPDDRYENLVEFLEDLIEAYDLDPLARSRLVELFRHDDHAGDIVPVKRRQRAIIPIEPVAGVSTTASGRMTPTRSVPGYTPPPAVKIQLEDDQPSYSRNTSTQRMRTVGPPEPSFLEPKLLFKWIIIVLIAGPLFWWIYDFVKTNMSAH